MGCPFGQSWVMASQVLFCIMLFQGSVVLAVHTAESGKGLNYHF